jgi:hypothetical protein
MTLDRGCEKIKQISYGNLNVIFSLLSKPKTQIWRGRKWFILLDTLSASSKKKMIVGTFVKAIFQNDLGLCKFIFCLYKAQNAICWKSSKRYLK